MNRYLLAAWLVGGIMTTASAENWPVSEGIGHRNASLININATPATAEVKWDRTFDRTWSYWTYYDQNFAAANLVVLEGKLALTATTQTGVATGYEFAHITVLDTDDGSVIVCSNTYQKHGFSPGACEYSWGRGPIAWDPDTGILYQCIGGDHPWNSACLPLANAHLYNPATGVAVAYQSPFAGFRTDHPNFRDSRNATVTECDSSSGEPPMTIGEWDIGTFGPTQHASNRSAAFDIQPGSPMIVCGSSVDHKKAGPYYITNKYTGRCCRYNWDWMGSTDTGGDAFKGQFSVLIDRDIIYYIGPWDATLAENAQDGSRTGIRLTGVRYVFQDNYGNDGYTGPGIKETSRNQSPFIFDYKLNSDPVGDISWPGTGDFGGWLAFLIDGAGDGIWIVWDPGTNQPYELIHATASAIHRYPVPGTLASEYLNGGGVFISEADCGADGSYIVFSRSPSSTTYPTGPLAIFDKTSGTFKWHFNLNDLGTTESTRMVVAGKYALIAYIDDAVTPPQLIVHSFDVTSATAPSTAPTPFVYNLTGITLTSPYLTLKDLIAVNGQAYALIWQDIGNSVFIDQQRVVAIGEIGASVIDVQWTLTPETGAARVVCVGDASGSSSTASGALTYEWDFDYDHLSFDVNATGAVVSMVFNYDGVKTDKNWHTVGVRITDSTGRSVIRTKQTIVTPDASADQSVFYPVTEECIINTTTNKWTDATSSDGRMRCSGTYGGAYGTGEHSRGYVNFAPVLLDSSYVYIGARLHFDVVRVNNTGQTTVHRMKPTETLTESSTWAAISAMTGVDQDATTGSPVTPLDTPAIPGTGAITFKVDDAVRAWLGRLPYSAPESQTGFLLCVHKNATPGTLDTGAFYSGEKSSFQWDWDPRVCRLEVIYNDTTASAPETITGVCPGSTASQSHPSSSALEIVWGAEGPITNVDIYYSTTSATSGWVSIASGETNDGHYSWATPVVSGTVWIRVTKAGNPSINSVSANSFAVTSGGTPTTYSISGTVSGSIQAGVMITLSGASSATTTTISGGTYSFTGLANGAYVLTPSLSGYTFTPTTRSVTISSANITGQTFTSAVNPIPTYSISGTVSGSIQAGITITLSGASSATTTTDSGGNFSFASLANGSYTLTPSLGGYLFTPASRSITVSSANVTGQNFTSAVNPTPTYSISGTVSGDATSGVTMILSGASSATTTTDISGNFSFTGLANGIYTITPSLSGYVFTPGTISGVSVSGSDVTGQMFASAVETTPTPSKTSNSSCAAGARPFNVSLVWAGCVLILAIRARRPQMVRRDG